MLVAALMLALVAAAPPEVTSVQAADSPIRIDRATILTAGADEPPVVLYAAENVTDAQVDEFTVIAYVFRDGVLKARQVAPGRRTLDAHTTKFSALVLDGIPIEPADVVVVGVNQAQRTGSDAWWRADLQEAAVATIAKRQKPRN
jgi:hypothetical protein